MQKPLPITIAQHQVTSATHKSPVLHTSSRAPSRLFLEFREFRTAMPLFFTRREPENGAGLLETLRPS
ncbi:hypothetical protein EBR25_08425 [bacterium]|nr:hypothetical protein [bacterium]